MAEKHPRAPLASLRMGSIERVMHATVVILASDGMFARDDASRWLLAGWSFLHLCIGM